MDLDIPSIYKVMQQELNAIDEKYFIHRLTYILEFSQRKGSLESMMHEFQSIVRSQKNFNPEELISGVLILKSNYGVHIFEGSDCAMVKHLKKLAKLVHNKTTNLMIKIRIFNLETHIHKRINHKWKCIDLTTKASNKESSATSKDIKEPLTTQFSICKADNETDESLFDKIYEKAFESVYQVQNVLVEKASTLIKLRQHSEQYEDVAHVLQSISRIFPDASILEYLINSTHLEELGIFLSKLLEAPAASLYHENIWPVPSMFVPLYFDISEFEFMRD
ncbi:uncharacterized protein LOC111047656 isoform X2 [Nilaparvata lugens]|uniref:uncharacterized protein LOC111047656 isoform X2 n=1 Tax=Nilaparvata lugens TaxID=108931 RepID=UPI00193D70D8|nr:uncharacterized protein LOC111047656 isoform X2 [Nilaparvata lugens]